MSSDPQPLLSVPLPEVVDGSRLRLQIWHPEHAEQMAAAVANSLEELRPWMPWAADEQPSVAEREELMAAHRAEWLAGGDGPYSILLGEQVIGSCGLHRRQGPGILEIGYWVDSDHVGRGFATEVVTTLTTVALNHPDISTVEVHHDRANVASGSVASKAGYVFAGMHADEVCAPGEEGVDCCWRYMTLPGFRIRCETPDDHVVISEVVAEAFASKVEAELVDDIRRSPEYVPELALVAEIDGDGGRQIVGHVMISGCVLRSADGSETAIKMLSPLAVDPELHRHGIGGALVKAVVDLADASGEPLVVLEGNPKYYNRFGFGPAIEHGITINVPDWAPVEAGQIIRLTNYDAALTGTVIYPEAFNGVD